MSTQKNVTHLIAEDLEVGDVVLFLEEEAVIEGIRRSTAFYRSLHITYRYVGQTETHTNVWYGTAPFDRVQRKTA